jgi:DNA-binding XRE family transcriptional regulator
MQNGRGKSKYSSWTPEDLTNFRKEAGLSRREVADSLGVSYRMYCYAFPTECTVITRVGTQK